MSIGKWKGAELGGSQRGMEQGVTGAMEGQHQGHASGQRLLRNLGLCTQGLSEMLCFGRRLFSNVLI